MYVVFLYFVWTPDETNAIKCTRNEVKLQMKRKANHRKTAYTSRRIRRKRPGSDFSISLQWTKG